MAVQTADAVGIQLQLALIRYPVHARVEEGRKGDGIPDNRNPVLKVRHDVGIAPGKHQLIPRDGLGCILQADRSRCGIDKLLLPGSAVGIQYVYSAGSRNESPWTRLKKIESAHVVLTAHIETIEGRRHLAAVPRHVLRREVHGDHMTRLKSLLVVPDIEHRLHLVHIAAQDAACKLERHLHSCTARRKEGTVDGVVAVGGGDARGANPVQ